MKTQPTRETDVHRSGVPPGLPAKDGRGSSAGGWSRPVTWLMVAVAWGILAVWSPQSGLAQELPYAEAYHAAVERYEAAADQRTRFQEENHDEALERVSEARAAGQDDRLEDALASFYTHAVELGDLDRQVAAAAEDLEEVRAQYLAALDEEEEAIHEALDAKDDAEAEQELHRRLADLRSEYRAVEGDVEIEDDLPPVPDLSVDPRDGPTELVHKARMLETRAEEYESVVREIDHRIESLEERVRRDRALQDNLADLSRFDDADVPVASSSGDPDDASRDAGSVDGLASSLGDLSPAEMITVLEEIRNQAESLRIEAVAQAEEFRSRVESSET